MANTPGITRVRLRASLLAALPWLLLSTAAWAANGAEIKAPFSLTPASRLWLEGSSTLHPYTSKATKLEVTVGFEPTSVATAADAKAAVLAGGLKSLTVSVPVDGLQSDEASLDKNLHKTLKPEVAPVIRFTLVGYETEPTNENVLVKARGRLAIAGAEKEIVVTANCSFSPTGIRVTGSSDVLMTDFGIKPPTMMLGAIKTADKVVVHFDLVLQASTPATPGN